MLSPDRFDSRMLCDLISFCDLTSYDNVTPTNHLTLADQSEIEGEAQCARQAAFIETMRATGQDMWAAEALLSSSSRCRPQKVMSALMRSVVSGTRVRLLSFFAHAADREGAFVTVLNTHSEERILVSEQVADLAAVCERQRALVALLVARGETVAWAEDLLLGFEAGLARMSTRLRDIQSEP